MCGEYIGYEDKEWCELGNNDVLGVSRKHEGT